VDHHPGAALTFRCFPPHRTSVWSYYLREKDRVIERNGQIAVAGC
jgi:hypothetical protein